jgi:hypothetical protein
LALSPSTNSSINSTVGAAISSDLNIKDNHEVLHIKQTLVMFAWVKSKFLKCLQDMLPQDGVHNLNHRWNVSCAGRCWLLLTGNLEGDESKQVL